MITRSESLANMSAITLSFAVHYASFMVYLAVLTCDLTYVDMPAHHTYGGRMKYLTFLSFLCGLVYNNLAAIMDFQMWMRSKDSPLWRNIRDFIFTTVVFPLATFVCLMFWGISFTDSSAMRSAENAKFVPWWMDHSYHTFPILNVFLQAFVIKHRYSRNRMALLCLSIFNVAYICWLFWIAHKSNFWVYPFLARMSLPAVILFVAVSVMVTFGFYFVGKKLSEFVWCQDKGKIS